MDQPPSRWLCLVKCSRGLVTWRVADAGIRRVHDRYISSPLQVHDLLLLRIRFLAGALETLKAQRRRSRGVQIGHGAARNGAVPTFHPGGYGAHPVTTSAANLDVMTRADPAAGSNTTSPPPSASRTPKNLPTDFHGMHQSDEKPGYRVIGQNGHRPTERAVIRTASFARTLSAICP